MSRNIKNGQAPSSPPPSAASSMNSTPVKGGGGLRPRPADFPDAAASGKRKSLVMFQAMETQSEADLNSLKSKVFKKNDSSKRVTKLFQTPHCPQVMKKCSMN